MSAENDDQSGAGEANVASLVERARKAQHAWSEVPIADRAEVVARVKDRILDRAEAIAREIYDDIGKPEIESLLGEVLPSGDVVSYWTDAIEELLDPVEVEIDRMTYGGKTSAIYRDARGVIALITPWNMPIAIPLRTIIPALLAGNAIVVKPSEVAPKSAKRLEEIFAGILPEGVLLFAHGDKDVGAKLASSDVDLVVFTGSVRAGRAVAMACAERLVPCSLELGGKDAAIVLRGANLNRAANGIVWGALTMGGQNCASVERVYVERSIADAFIDKVVSVVQSLKDGSDLGPLATNAQQAIVKSHVDDAIEKGGKLLVGGKAKDDRGFDATVIRVDDDRSTLMMEETFGPVIPIAVVDSADEAIERANASRFGLTASVWTKDIDRAQEIAKRLRAGVVTINNHAFTGAIPAAPWSGVGESGHGITNSPLALDHLTRPRFVLVDRSRNKRELWWYPYTPALRTMALALAVLKSGASGFVAKAKALASLITAAPKRLLGG
jgi:acyl-CoA reductase-like NAD-dependent aldehyde dehydrogenase